jgi:hypothetical protein
MASTKSPFFEVVNTPSARGHKHRKWPWIVLLVVLVLAGGIFAFSKTRTGSEYITTITNKITGKSGATKPITVDGVKIEKLSQQDLIDKVNLLNQQGKTKAAQQLIEYQTYYKSDSSVMVMYAQEVAQNGSIDKALQILADAENGSGSKQYWYRGQAALILQAAGQKTKAIDYYNQAIKLAKAVKSANDNEAHEITAAVADYQYYINELENSR